MFESLSDDLPGAVIRATSSVQSRKHGVTSEKIRIVEGLGQRSNRARLVDAAESCRRMKPDGGVRVLQQRNQTPNSFPRASQTNLPESLNTERDVSIRKCRQNRWAGESSAVDPIQ